MVINALNIGENAVQLLSHWRQDLRDAVRQRRCLAGKANPLRDVLLADDAEFLVGWRTKFPTNQANAAALAAPFAAACPNKFHARLMRRRQNRLLRLNLNRFAFWLKRDCHTPFTMRAIAPR